MSYIKKYSVVNDEKQDTQKFWTTHIHDIVAYIMDRYQQLTTKES